MAYQLLNFRNPINGAILPAAYLRAGRIALDADNFQANVILKIYENFGIYTGGGAPLETLSLNITGASYTSTFSIPGSSSVNDDAAVINDVYSNIPTNPLTQTLLVGSTVVP